MGAGAAIALAGLVLLFRPRADQATTFIDVLGIKFRSSSVGLIVFLIGAAFMAMPLLIAHGPGTVEDRTGARAPVVQSPSIDNVGEPLEVERGDIVLPVRAQAEEIEPNDHISDANQIEIGNTYGGSISDSDQDWYAFRTGEIGPERLRVILRGNELRGSGAIPGCEFHLYDEVEDGVGSEVARPQEPATGLFNVGPDSVYYLRIGIRNYTDFCAYELALSLE